MLTDETYNNDIMLLNTKDKKNLPAIEIYMLLDSMHTTTTSSFSIFYDLNIWYRNFIHYW